MKLLLLNGHGRKYKSLTFDLQKPFRFPVDLAVINLVENNTWIRMISL